MPQIEERRLVAVPPAEVRHLRAKIASGVRNGRDVAADRREMAVLLARRRAEAAQAELQAAEAALAHPELTAEPSSTPVMGGEGRG